MVPSAWSRTTALLILSAVACSAGESSTETAIPLPDEIHGLQLVESQSGPDAAEMIEQEHGQDVAPVASVVGHYGPEEMRAALYISRFASDEEALAQLVAMSTKIGRGSGGFGHHTSARIKGMAVHTVFGLGQIHYFYAEGVDLTWVSLPPTLARAALAELLEIPLDSLPDQVGGPPPVEI